MTEENTPAGAGWEIVHLQEALGVASRARVQIQVDFSESGLVFYAANLGNCAEFTVTWRRLKNMPISLFEAIVEVLTAKVLQASEST